MINPSDLPNSLPVFPLPRALLLPRARLPLQLFEPRYLAMLDDVLKTSDRLIGMIQPVGSATDAQQLHSIGCAGRVTNFSETNDGRYMITLTGISRFKLGEEISGFTPYPRYEVSWSDFEHDLGQTEDDPGFNRQKLITMLGQYFETLDLETDWDSLQAADPELLISSLSILCPFDTGDKQALLEAPNLKERREMLLTLIEFALRGGTRKETMQ